MNCRPKRTRKKYRKREINRRLEKKRIDFIVKKYEGSEEKAMLVIKKVSHLTRIFEFATHILYVILHFCIWIFFCGLITIGVNTLLKGEIKELIFQLFRQFNIG